MTTQKKGFIKISNELYVNHWNEIYVIMKDFRPINIDYRHWENDTWYIYGVSEMFDELKEGEVLPQYLVIFEQNNGKRNYRFEKVN